MCLVNILVHSDNKKQKPDSIYFLEFPQNNFSFLFLVHFCDFFLTAKDLSYETHIDIMFKSHFIKSYVCVYKIILNNTVNKKLCDK